jgi:DNA-binding response OmpR family regulator
MNESRWENAVAVVADDESDILELVEIALEDLGLRVIGAPDGQRALELAMAHCPDIVILDVTMPGLTGLEVTEKLRSFPGTADAAIMLLTARVHASDVALGVAAGADRYVTKPFSPVALAAEVEQLLERRAGAER